MPRHYGKGVKTIRGTIEDVGVVNSRKLIFNYESPDRTRGWIVKGAWAWVSDPFKFASSDNSDGSLLANLATDKYTPTKNDIISPDDNRSMAWLNILYRGKNFASQDFYVPNSGSIPSISFLLDLDRIITNDLYINAMFYDSASDSAKIDVGYMIVLEQVDLSPSQSLLQQLKGIGQDVDN